MTESGGNAPAPLGVDARGVHQWMTERGLAPGELRFDRIGAGQSNLTYRVRDLTHAWVLRRPPLGTVLESAHDVLREARVMSALRDTGVPVPEVYGVLPRGTVAPDAAAFLMSYVEGVVLDRDETIDEMPAQHRRTIGLSLARTLAAVHAVDLQATGLTTLARHTPYAPRQLRRWSRQWEQSRTRDLPAVEALAARLTAATPPQRETTLVHGDGHLLNVVASTETGCVSALLDWELSTLGDPLADLGTLLAYWPAADEPAVQHLAPSQREHFATRDDLVEAYVRTTGRDVSHLPFWHVLGLWKVAVIAEGIRHRAQDDTAERAPHQDLPAARVDAIVEHAHEVAAAAGI